MQTNKFLAHIFDNNYFKIQIYANQQINYNIFPLLINSIQTHLQRITIEKKNELNLK